jgi:hypothetical protein
MKSQESIVNELGYTATGPRGTCRHMNETAYNWARNAVTPAELATYDGSGVTLTFGPDGQSQTGPDFVYYDEMTLEETAIPDTYELTSSAILVGDGVTGNPDKDNVFYCKIWSPARAVYWILEQK